MRQIRRNVFETNSSSTHSIAFATRDEFEKWSDGELFYKRSWSGESKFLTMSESVAEIKSNKYYSGELDNTSEMNNEDVYEIFREYDIYDYEHWGYDYESDVTHYTTPGGEEIVAVCYYGYNG